MDKIVIVTSPPLVQLTDQGTRIACVRNNQSAVTVADRQQIVITSAGAQGPKGEPGESAGAQYTIRYAETSLHIYVGEAAPSTEESAAEWRVKRLTKSSNSVLWADGNSDFDNVWSDYLTLSYS